MLVLLSTLILAALQDAKDPDDLLNKLNQDLQAAIKKAPKDADSRGKLTAAAKAIFDKEIGTAAPKSPKPIWDWQTHFQDLLLTADKKYAQDALKSERGVWIAACKSVFTRQITVYKEAETAPEDMPAADAVYDKFNDAVDKAKGAFVNDSSFDLRTAALGGANEIFGKVLAKAKKSSRDPQRWYEDTLAKIDKEYPLSTEKNKKYNAEPNASLKTAAKATFDHALKK